MAKEAKKKFEMNSQTVSWLLIGSIFLLAVAAIVGSWFLQQTLTEQAKAADHAKIDTELSQSELQRSKTLETYMLQNKPAIEKASSVVAETKTYQYQNQIVNDIESYAQKAGVVILGFNFPQDTAAAKSDATGLKSVNATLTLKSPVPYKNYLKFMKYIEQNITKMQITDISLTPDEENLNNIESTDIGLKVYVR